MSNKRLQQTTVVSLRLPIPLLDAIRKMADAESRTVANKIRLMLKEAANGGSKK